MVEVIEEGKTLTEVSSRMKRQDEGHKLNSEAALKEEKPIQKFQNASTSEAQKQLLVQQLASDEKDTLFTDQNFRLLLAYVLHDVDLFTYIDRFSPETVIVASSDFLLHQNSSRRSRSSSSNQTGPTNAEKVYRTQLAFRFLTHFLEVPKDNPGSFPCWIDTIHEMEEENGSSIGYYRSILDRLVHIALVVYPSIIANSPNDMTQDFEKARYKTTVEMQQYLTSWAVAALEWSKKPQPSLNTLYFVRTLLSRLTRRHEGKLVAQGLWQYYNSRCKDDSIEFVRQLSRMDFSSSESATICKALILWAVSQKDEDLEFLKMCFEALIRSSRTYENFVQLAVLLPTGIPIRDDADMKFCSVTVKMLVSLPRIEEDLSDSEDESQSTQGGIFLEQVDRVAAFWSQLSFATNSAPTFHRHVSYFLEASLKQLGSLDSSIALPLSLLPGVEARLHLTDAKPREFGMRVAEALATAMGEELHFSEIHQSREDRPDVTTKQMPSTEAVSSHVVITSTDDDDESVWSDGDIIDPYNQDDDESDLGFRPRHVRECLEMLQTPEGEEGAFDKHETGLLALPELISARPYDLPDYAYNLTDQLLHLEDKFQIEDFDNRVFKALANLVQEEPFLAGETLINSAFIRDGAFRVRVLALSVISQVSYELANPVSIDTPTSIDNFSDTVLSRLPQNLAAKTRLKNNRLLSRVKEKTKHKYRFESVGVAWFYQIIEKFMQTRGEQHLWGNEIGAQLLSHVMNTLSIILDCVPVGPPRNVMSSDLFQLSWTFRSSDTVEVRRSVLFCIQACINGARVETILKLIESQDNVADELALVASKDTDESCQTLAKQTFHHILSKIEPGIRSLTP